jgi:hypothetical protein
MVESDPIRLQETVSKLDSLHIGNRVKLENSRNRLLETIIIKGDEAGLEEGMLALRKGAKVTELNLVCTLDSHNWQFTIKGESLHLADVKTPATGPMEDQSDMEGKIIEKAYLYEEAIRIVDNLYKTFLAERLSSDWKQRIMTKIKRWIYA